METITLENGLQFVIEGTVVEPVEPDNYIEDVNTFCYIAINHKRV